MLNMSSMSLIIVYIHATKYPLRTNNTNWINSVQLQYILAMRVMYPNKTVHISVILGAIFFIINDSNENIYALYHSMDKQN